MIVLLSKKRTSQSPAFRQETYNTDLDFPALSIQPYAFCIKTAFHTNFYFFKVVAKVSDLKSGIDIMDSAT